MLQRRLLPILLSSLVLFAGHATADSRSSGRYGAKASTCSSTRAVWVPGHRERVERRRWVPGGTRREWIPAEVRRVCGPWGTVREVVVRPGRWVLVPVPGHYEDCHDEVWIPGAWTHTRR